MNAPSPRAPTSTRTAVDKACVPSPRQLQLLSKLLDYPDEALWTHAAELRNACRSGEPDTDRQSTLLAFVDDLLALDPMAAQERWLALFDRGRAMSLLLFEHIHGESRDRGQAMVDLVETYRRHGFELSTRELPDYLPLVLEFLSRRPASEAGDWLSHVSHILHLLAARATERGSPYGPLFDALAVPGARDGENTSLRARARAEERDDSAEAIDRVWEEEAVRFGAQQPEEDCEPPRRTLPSGHSIEAQVKS